MRARVEAEEAAKAAVQAAAVEDERQGQMLQSKHVRNDYVRVMKWSNPAVELAASGSSVQLRAQAQATAALATDFSATGTAAAAQGIALDHAKYAECVHSAPCHIAITDSFTPLSLRGTVTPFCHGSAGTRGARLPPTPPAWPP